MMPDEDNPVSDLCKGRDVFAIDVVATLGRLSLVSIGSGWDETETFVDHTVHVWHVSWVF